MRQTSAERCQQDLSRLAREGSDLRPALAKHFDRLPDVTGKKAFACEVLSGYSGGSVNADCLAGLQYTPQAVNGRWSHIAGAISDYIRNLPADVYLGAGARAVIGANAADAALFLAPPNPARVGAPKIISLATALPSRSAAGDYALTIRHAGSGAESRVMVNDEVSVGAIKWLCYAMTGLSVAGQQMERGNPSADTRLSVLRLKDSDSPKLTIEGTPSALNRAQSELRDEFIDLLHGYVEDLPSAVSPATFLTACLTFVQGTSEPPISSTALATVYCDMCDANALAEVSPCLHAFTSIGPRSEALELLTRMHPQLRLTAAPSVAMYLLDESLSDAQRLEVVRVLADFGEAEPGNAGELALASKKIDAFQHTLAALAAGSGKFGGSFMMNRCPIPDSEAYIERSMARLMQTDAPTDLPVGTLLGRRSQAAQSMRTIIACLKRYVPDIMQDHDHGGAPKARCHDVFDGQRRISGASIIFSGFNDASDADLESLASQVPSLGARLRNLRNPLLAAYALCQPRRIERNLRICEKPLTPHNLRDLPFRAEGRGRAAEEVNNVKTAAWIAGLVETLLDNPDNCRNLSLAWQQFKEYATHQNRGSQTRAKMRMMVDAPHVDGVIARELASEKLWRRKNRSQIPYTHILSAAWTSAGRHGLTDALLTNLGHKVELGNAAGQGAHVYCQHGLSQMIGNCLQGWEEGIGPNPYLPPGSVRSTIIDKYYNFQTPHPNAVEVMAIRREVWHAAEQHFGEPEWGAARNDFEELIDTYEQNVYIDLG